MSTRYVWGKYTVLNPFEKTELQGVDSATESSLTAGTSYSISGGNTIIPSGSTTTLYRNSTIDATVYRYIKYPSHSGIYYADTVSAGYVWRFSTDSAGKGRLRLTTTTDSAPILVSYLEVGSGGPPSAGSLVNYVSSKSSNAFPSNATLDDYWYQYRGSDNIDPTAVRYSVSDLYSGEPFTITVTPRTPTYGGTVYYRYQYSINGGSTWRDIGSRTTATSTTVTIPEGAERFQARVLASDGWGFTSSTYVYGPVKEVSQLKAYVGIGGKAVALKKGYVGVGGKAMQLVKGYVGVGGVAKKLF